MVIRSLQLLAPLAVAALFIGLSSCQEPYDAPPHSGIRSMAPDGHHIILGFPDELSEAPDTSGIVVFSDTATRLRVNSVSLDSLSGTLITVSISEPYELKAPLKISLKGMHYARGQAVSEETLELSVLPGLLYERDISPLFAARCNSCHGPDNASGSYRTDSRNALYDFGSDEPELNRSPNLIPGNERCQLAVKTSYRGREFTRANLSFYESEMIRQWILLGDASILPEIEGERTIKVQPMDFTHVRVQFPFVPVPEAALALDKYRFYDLDSPDTSVPPSSAAIEPDHPNLITLEFPTQRLFHNYSLHMGSMTDRFDAVIFDSSSTVYQALLSYQADIAPLFERTCLRCHGPGVTESLRGFYRTDSYGALFGLGSDSLSDLSERNLIPTDSSCLLIVKTRQSAGKTGLCALRSPLTPLESHRITDWIVSYYARQQK